MGDETPSALQRLWSAAAGSERRARLGLSLERIVASGVELADQDGLGAVSMKRVAEHLGFTTMSLYRYVASKDELLLMMQDSCWMPPAGVTITDADWRAGLEAWTREQVGILREHPWLEQVRHVDRAGTPSQIMWLELGLRTLAQTPLSEYQKVEVLLLLSGYTFSYARFSATATEAVRRGYFDAGDQAPAFAGLLRDLAGPDRFPALIGAVTGGAFTPDRDFPDFEFDLRVLLDGIAALVARARAAEETAGDA
jgi:AcrR family transcriptional regulator